MTPAERQRRYRQRHQDEEKNRRASPHHKETLARCKARRDPNRDREHKQELYFRFHGHHHSGCNALQLKTPRLSWLDTAGRIHHDDLRSAEEVIAEHEEKEKRESSQ
jgi:hypothetical protein